MEEILEKRSYTFQKHYTASSNSLYTEEDIFSNIRRLENLSSILGRFLEEQSEGETLEDLVEAYEKREYLEKEESVLSPRLQSIVYSD